MKALFVLLRRKGTLENRRLVSSSYDIGQVGTWLGESDSRSSGRTWCKAPDDPAQFADSLRGRSSNMNVFPERFWPAIISNLNLILKYWMS